MIKHSIVGTMNTHAGDDTPVHEYVMKDNNVFDTSVTVRTTGLVGGDSAYTNVILDFSDTLSPFTVETAGYSHNGNSAKDDVHYLEFSGYGDIELRQLATMLEFAARVLRNQVNESYDDNDGVASWLDQSGGMMILANDRSSRNPQEYYTCTDCYNDYRQYCEVMKYTPVTFRQFGIRLSERYGIVSQSRRGHRVYINAE